MTCFSEGDRVIIRFGKRQGQQGEVIKSRTADVYQVRSADGCVLFFSGKGLAREDEGICPSVP
jgi:hypothetical protein